MYKKRFEYFDPKDKTFDLNGVYICNSNDTVIKITDYYFRHISEIKEPLCINK